MDVREHNHEGLQRCGTPLPAGIGVLVGGILVFLVLRSFLVPKSFGQYGHYRGNAIAEIAARPIPTPAIRPARAATRRRRRKRKSGKHAHVNCEACHGPLAKHADDPARSAGKARHGGAVRPLPEANRQAEGIPAGASADHSAGLPCDTCHQPHSPVIEASRRQEMNITRRHMLMLLPAAAVAWKYVLAGTPEAAPNYKMTEHWWGMLIDICRSASAAAIACAPARRKTMCPTATSAPGSSAITSPTATSRIPQVDSPDGGKKGFPPAEGRRRKELLRSEAVQPLRGFALHAGLPGGRDVRQPGWRGAGRQEILPRLPVLRPGLPVRLPLHQSEDANAPRSARSAITGSPRA